MNNCLSKVISTESERKPWKKRLVWFTGEFMGEHVAVNSRCTTVKSLLKQGSLTLWRPLWSFLVHMDPCISYASFVLSKLQAYSIGSFSNDDCVGNEDVKKATGLLHKTKTLHVHHAFLYISLPSFQNYDVKMPNCKFY